MGKNKLPQPFKKNQISVVRSSAAEYLTFVAAGGQSETSVEMRYEDENIWLTQKMMSTVYDVSVPAISQHLKRIFAHNELEEAAVIKQYLTTAADGKNYQVKHYSLQAIIAVGFKIENERAVQLGLSGVLCLRHTMTSDRRQYAQASKKDAESQRSRTRGGIAQDPA